MTAPGQPLEIVDDVEVDSPHDGEVSVRVGYCGVCGSDLAVHGAGTTPTPSILGHEAAGLVERVGPGVERFKPGDSVVLSVAPSCGRCFFCTRGKASLCEESLVVLTGQFADGSTRLSRRAVRVYRGVGLAAFAETVVARTSAVVKVPSDTPLELACLVGCGVGTGVGAALNTASVEAGSTVLVMGLGGVGMAIVQGARIAGAARIIASDPVAERRDWSEHFGATDAVDPSKDDVVSRVMALTRYGADYAFDAVGRPELVKTGIAAIRSGGTMVVVGIPTLDASYAIEPAVFFVLGEKVLRGCAYGSSNPHRDIPRYLALWRAGKLDLEGMVTARRPLEEANAAFTDLQAGRGIRTVLSVAPDQ